MLAPDEVRRLFPHVEERRLLLGLPQNRAPTSSTHGRLSRGQPIQRTTLDNIDDRLAGTDGLWPPGTAYWLATGRIDRPGRRPGDVRRTASIEDLKGLYVKGGRLLAELPNATPEQLAKIDHYLDEAWAVLDERQGR